MAGKPNLSPIVRAMKRVSTETPAEIRVHFSKRWFERDVFENASQVFRYYKMDLNQEGPAILLYINQRKRQFAIVADEAIHAKVGQAYWDGLAKHLRQDLLSTHIENAISMALETLGFTLKRHFPNS